MSESLPNVREAPERPPAPDSDAAQAAASAIADDFIDQGVPVAGQEPSRTGVTVGDALAAVSAPAVDEENPPLPEPDLLDDSTPAGYEWLDEEPESDLDEEPAVEPEEEEFYVDDEDEAAKLRAKVRKAERRAEHERELRVRGERKNWREEALRVFPYSKHKIDTIDATSKRAFLREAQALHKETIQTLREYGGVPASEVAAAEIERVAQEHRAEVARQYGKPTAGPPGSAVTQAEADREYQEAREKAKRTGNLGNLFSTMAKLGR